MVYIKSIISSYKTSTMKTYMKFISILSLSLLFILTINTDMQAQSKKRKKRVVKTESTTRNSRLTDDDEITITKPWKERLTYEIGVGNISFFGGGSSNQFNIAFKPSVGYKIFDRLAAGVYLKGDYLFVNTNNEDFSLFDYGAGIYSRFRIIEALYLKGEFGYQSYAYERVAANIIIIQKSFLVPMIGAGYSSGFGKWKYGFEVLFNLNNDARDYSSKLIEYWLKFDYNF